MESFGNGDEEGSFLIAGWYDEKKEVEFWSLNVLVSRIIMRSVRSRDQAEGRNEREGSWETRPFSNGEPSNAVGSRTSVWGRLGMSPLG